MISENGQQDKAQKCLRVLFICYGCFIKQWLTVADFKSPISDVCLEIVVRS